MRLEPVTDLISWLLQTFSCFKAKRFFILVLPLLMAVMGCTAPLHWQNIVSISSPLELTLRQVELSDRPGVYSVAGSTSLPDQTLITVSAIRYFKAATPVGKDLIAERDYSILDRQFAAVTQGNWQTTVHLWQVAADGTFGEAWQLNPEQSEFHPAPEPEVTFLATLDPANQPTDLQRLVERQDASTQTALVRFTTEGEFYLQASKTLSIALPTGRTSPPATPAAPTPRQSNPQLVKDSPEATETSETSTPWKQTDAPLSPDQILR